MVLALNLLAAAGSPQTHAAEPPACTIAALGDSLTAGYGVALADAWPARLQTALQARGWPCRVTDAGVSGDTSAGGRARLAWVLADRPTHLVVELGGNDGLRALPVQALADNLAAIVAGARSAGVAVLLAGMRAPPNLGDEYTGPFANVYADLAQRYQLPLIDFILDGVIQEPALMQADGIHPNSAGYARLVERILPPVEAWLAVTGVTRINR